MKRERERGRKKERERERGSGEERGRLRNSEILVNARERGGREGQKDSDIQIDTVDR